MTIDEFRRLAEAWGGDIGRWPEATRDAAARLSADAEAAAILAEATALDRLAAAATPDIPAQRTADAINAVMMRLAARPAVTPRPSWRWPRWLMPAAGLAVATAFGICVGVFYPAATLAPSPRADALVTAIIGDDISFLTTVLQ